MSEAIEDIPTMTATRRLVELLRGEESGSWQKVDAAREAIEEDWTPPAHAGGSANTGLSARIAEVWEEITDNNLPEPLEIKTIRGWYTTARAWPLETRVKGASFRAHTELTGSQWKHRQGILNKLVGRKQKGIVNGDDVRRWKQEKEGGSPVVPWEERFYKRLDSTVHSQSFGLSTPEEWRKAISLVRTLLGDMQNELEEIENA